MSDKLTPVHKAATDLTADEILAQMASRDVRRFLNRTPETPKTADEMLAEMAANVINPDVVEISELHPSPELQRVFAELRKPLPPQ